MSPSDFIKAGVLGNLGTIEGHIICEKDLSSNEAGEKFVLVPSAARDRRRVVCMHTLKDFRPDKLALRMDRMIWRDLLWMPTLGRAVRKLARLTARFRHKVNRLDLVVMYITPPEVHVTQTPFQKLIGVYDVSIHCYHGGGHYE